ncbi:translation initiation factor IF-2-like isoform X2 [Mustela erminea]|uniref:translation initiation factor IF-2-like isoform X2 n=1 Tax=Mustela erminea TaxID=36723 RepID=UPI00138736B3|nr:translation initiation factor IF-2-like isoform X2 [Mustela erminea]
MSQGGNGDALPTHLLPVAALAKHKLGHGPDPVSRRRAPSPGRSPMRGERDSRVTRTAAAAAPRPGSAVAPDPRPFLTFACAVTHLRAEKKGAFVGSPRGPWPAVSWAALPPGGRERGVGRGRRPWGRVPDPTPGAGPRPGARVRPGKAGRALSPRGPGLLREASTREGMVSPAPGNGSGCCHACLPWATWSQLLMMTVHYEGDFSHLCLGIFLGCKAHTWRGRGVQLQSAKDVPIPQILSSSSGCDLHQARGASIGVQMSVAVLPGLGIKPRGPLEGW